MSKEYIAPPRDTGNYIIQGDYFAIRPDDSDWWTIDHMVHNSNGTLTLAVAARVFGLDACKAKMNEFNKANSMA